MTHTFKTTIAAALSVTMIATSPMAAQADCLTGTAAVDGSYELSQTNGMDRRGDRRDDRQDRRGDRQDDRQSFLSDSSEATFEVADTRGMDNRQGRRGGRQDNRGDRQDSRQG